MNSITVTAERTYQVNIGVDFKEHLVRAIEGRSKVAIIFSEDMKEMIPRDLSVDSDVHFFPIPNGEEGKSAETLFKMWDWLGAAGFTRSDLIVSIGGGAVSDLAGFAAATWLRGIDWIAIPTTVAAMVDASVGGKTGINSDYGKNLVGSFHSPVEVVIDFCWLDSLSDRDFVAGLAEVIKCGFIADPKILEILERSSLSDIRQDRTLTAELVERSIAVKATVVSSDFRESHAREALNYGHTFGHAVEKDSSYSLRHGEAVSIGMAFIAQLTLARGVIDTSLCDRHLSLLARYGLPITYSSKNWPQLLAHMKLDKKSRGAHIRFVALDGIGKTQRIENATDEELHQAYEKIQP